MSSKIQNFPTTGAAYHACRKRRKSIVVRVKGIVMTLRPNFGIPSDPEAIRSIRAIPRCCFPDNHKFKGVS